MKSHICLGLVLLTVSLFSLVLAQENQENPAVKRYTHDDLRALEYDADIAETWEAEALRAYLTGNILVGIWAESSTRQYFAPSGTTWYQEEDNP